MHSGVIVDFGGVLTNSFEGTLRSFCVREGLAPDFLGKIFSLDTGAHGALSDLERGAISQAEFASRIAPALGASPDRLIERMLSDLRGEPIVTSTVQELRSVGIRVCVLSNSWGTDPFDPYEPYELGKNYDAVVISHEVGLRKPDPKIFSLAVRKLGLMPSECVFVDDVARYLEPARKLGMGVIHATAPEATAAALKEHFSHVL